MQKIYIVLLINTFSLSLMGMEFDKRQRPVDPAQDQETIILNFLKAESEKDTEALKQEFIIRQLLNHKTREEKALILKNQSPSECAFCKIM